jgi:DNA recombination protein RmuC
LKTQLRDKTVECAQTVTQKEALEARLKEQTEHTDQLFRQMEDRFKSIASDVIRQNTGDLSRLSAERMQAVVDPLATRIREFRDKVEDCYGKEAEARTSLKDEIARLVEANQRISEDANNLAEALKGNTKTQGDWGEMILDDILQQSGLKEGVHYHKQEYTRDSSGRIATSDNGSAMRTDVVVEFPGHRKMIIDSKVSLTAYYNYANTENKDDAARYLKEHLRSVTDHIKELSQVDYSSYIDEAPDFVMMFMPVEPAYYLAIQSRPTLWKEAYDSKVILINPTNLIMALRLALDLWRKDDQIKNLGRIISTATSLYDKAANFTDSMDKIGTTLDTLTKTYHDAMGRLSQGRGSMLSLTKRLMQYGITPRKQISRPTEDDDDETGDDHSVPEKSTD